MLEFDYIVIGGGTAGCVVAGKLASSELGSILVVEPGTSPISRILKIPVLYPHAFRSKWDWCLATEPQLNLNGRRIPWPRGKSLGGSSSINASIYTRGHRADFDRWAANGASGWSYEEVLPWFVDNERRLGLIEQDTENGFFEIHPLSQVFLQSGRLLRWDVKSRLDLESNLGIGPFQVTRRRGRRYSAFAAFLKPVVEGRTTPEQLTRMRLLTSATVVRIDFNLDRAYGIHVVVNDSVEFVHARKAIVLCAGTIHSPALLMRSGIGSRTVMESLGIQTRLNLPGVGQNLQDHLIFPLVYSTSQIASIERDFSRESRLEYAKSRNGPMASNIAEVGGFGRLGNGCSDLMTSATRLEQPPPDYQIHFMPSHYLEYPIREQPRNAFSIGVTWLHPSSRGTVRIVSQDVNQPPMIDPQYVSESSDLERLIDTIREVRVIGATGILKSKTDEELIPGSKRVSDDQIARSIRVYASSLFHPIGTCRMGCDDQSVVDPFLRVRGLSNLYIADASVMPEIPSGNTQAATMMIASRLAASIVDDHFT